MKNIKSSLVALLFCSTVIAQSPSGTKPLTKEADPLSEDSTKSIMKTMSSKLFKIFTNSGKSIYYDVINTSKNTTTSFSVNKAMDMISIYPVLTFMWDDIAKGPTSDLNSIKISFNALLYATKYINFFEQKKGTVLENESSILLSRKNFQEFKTKGKTFLDIGNGLEEFKLYDTVFDWDFSPTRKLSIIGAKYSNTSVIEVLDDINTPIILLIKTDAFTIQLKVKDRN